MTERRVIKRPTTVERAPSSSDEDELEMQANAPPGTQESPAQEQMRSMEDALSEAIRDAQTEAMTERMMDVDRRIQAARRRMDQDRVRARQRIRRSLVNEIDVRDPVQRGERPSSGKLSIWKKVFVGLLIVFVICIVLAGMVAAAAWGAIVTGVVLIGVLLGVVFRAIKSLL